MELLRIVTATFRPHPELHETWGMQLGGVKVTTLSLGSFAKDFWKTMLVAKVKIDLPRHNSKGFMVIPTYERLKCERALETSANLISIFSRSSRKLASATPDVALIPETEQDRILLSSMKGIEGDNIVLPNHQFIDQLNPELIILLKDRADGIALLAEAHSHNHSSGKFHELVRVFECAFALSFRQLHKKLFQFLDPIYEYSMEEIKSWIYFRDPLTHADGKKTKSLVLETDIYKSIARMEQAAYDVIYNKEIWHDRSKTRREVWKPQIFSKSNLLDGVAYVGSQPTVGIDIFDRFGSYPLDLNAIISDPPHAWWYKKGNGYHLEANLEIIEADKS